MDHENMTNDYDMIDIEKSIVRLYIICNLIL